MYAAGEVITITGVVSRIEPIKYVRKLTCFKCAMCQTEIVVKQITSLHEATSSYRTVPSACRRGCPAVARFEEVTTSPFTITQAQQTITIKENLYGIGGTTEANVELIQDLVNTVSVGTVVTIFGVVKHTLDKSQKYRKLNDSKHLIPYIKCLSIENRHQTSCGSEMSEIARSALVQAMMAETSTFKVLINSFCTNIFGRDKVKAGLILALLSGNSFSKFRRSESHILLVGSPAVGKTELLKACAEVSQKGILVCGPTLTAAGLLGVVSSNGKIDAGSLILADGGVCCIDEFDKMKQPEILLESMAQGVVSIAKCGVSVNMSAHTVIIAAANPKNSNYDKTKTIVENVGIHAPLMSRFDLIFALERITNVNEEMFSDISSNKSIPIASSSNSINVLITELKTITSEHLKFYIDYARRNCNPKLSEDAKANITKFYLELNNKGAGENVQVITHRQIEALLRLTIARARADLSEVATGEHALEVIEIMKCAMVDLFPP